MKTIDEQIADLEEEIRTETKWRRELIAELKQQKVCEHQWVYTPAQKGDSFCFQRDVGETISCEKCDFSLEREYDRRYNNLTNEQEELFARVKKELGVI